MENYTRQQRGLIPIRRSVSRVLNTVLLKCVVMKGYLASKFLFFLRQSGW